MLPLSNKTSQHLQNIFAFLLGAISCFAFAPYYYFPLILIPFAGLLLLNKTQNTKSVIFFGFGFFFFGIHWITIALNTFGQMPYVGAILSTITLCIFLSLFFLPLNFYKNNIPSAIFVASSFTIFEWIRSFIFTGFPWLSLGYSQIPNGPLAGFLPILGIHGVSFLLILTVTLMLQCFTRNWYKNVTILIILLLIWVGGIFLKKINWTEPVGNPIKVSLIQGNIDQSIKWDKSSIQLSLEKYLDLISKSNGELIILPETSVPLVYQKIPQNFLLSLQEKIKVDGSKIILGAIYNENSNYYNSAIFLDDDKTRVYHKHHLVPFGEFIPLREFIGFIYDEWLQIPFNDLSRGSEKQELFNFKNNQLAPNICYEDVFGNEIIRSLPNATILINISNDAWYGQSNAAYQHLQISQARAIETGRMMLRATNTGATAIINNDGTVISQLPHFTEGLLEGDAQGFKGLTPYAQYGNYLIIIISILGVLVGLRGKTKL